ncbi:hypothetical protein NFI96_020856 [Prochilodus magdalenae]|nr:hypothetical protein NFI96_020856 [Prochilodus magdalenae]
MATRGGRSKGSECEENPPTRKGQHIPKEGKKKKRNKAKEKDKSTSEVKKRGHPSTPSNSDDSERPRTEERAKAEKSSDLNEAKGHAKERGSRKSRKCKTTAPVLEEDPGPPKEDKAELSSQTQESLRWEGVLEDPAAEAERMELYRANRRKRYMASRQTFLENIGADFQTGPVRDVSKLGRVPKAGATAKAL